MAWYTTGTVTVTASNNTVTGSGTNFIANAHVGDAFRGPDGRWYEVTNIASATAISISPVYQGSTASGQAYSIAPMQGYVKASADALRQITNTYGSTLAALQPWSTAATASIALDNLGFGATGKAIAAAATTAAAQTAIGATTGATDETLGRLRRTQDSPGYSKNNTWSGSNTFTSPISASTLISSIASAAYDIDGAGGSANSIPAGIAYHDGVGWVNLPLSDVVPLTVKVINSRSFQLGISATAGRAFFRGLHSTVANTWREFYTTGNTSENVQSMLGAANNSAIRTSISSSTFPAYTVSTVPSASANANLGIIVTNAASPGRRPFWSDGTNWRDAAGAILS